MSIKRRANGIARLSECGVPHLRALDEAPLALARRRRLLLPEENIIGTRGASNGPWVVARQLEPHPSSHIGDWSASPSRPMPPLHALIERGPADPHSPPLYGPAEASNTTIHSQT